MISVLIELVDNTHVNVYYKNMGMVVSHFIF